MHHNSSLSHVCKLFKWLGRGRVGSGGMDGSNKRRFFSQETDDWLKMRATSDWLQSMLKKTHLRIELRQGSLKKPQTDKYVATHQQTHRDLFMCIGMYL